MTRRSAILANLLLSLPIVTGLLGAAPNASAQTNQMTTTIPFDFSIGSHHLAAGFYSVEQVSGYALEVRNNKTRNSVFLMVRGENRYGSVTRSRLVFVRAGRGMYLTQAWFAGTNARRSGGEAQVRPRACEAECVGPLDHRSCFEVRAGGNSIAALSKELVAMALASRMPRGQCCGAPVL